MTLSAGELAQIIHDINDYLPDTVTRTRITPVDDGMGGQTESRATTTYSGRLMPTGQVPKEYLEGMRLSGDTVYVVVLPYNADVLSRDELSVNSHTLTVVGVKKDLTWDAETIVVCEEAH